MSITTKNKIKSLPVKLLIISTLSLVLTGCTGFELGRSIRQLPEWTSYYAVANANADLHGSAEATGLSNEQISRIRELANLEFRQVIAWVDGSPSVAYPMDNPAERHDISVSKQGYFNQISQFVDTAHQQGLKAHLYTTWAIAVRRKDGTDGRPFMFETSIAVEHPDKFTVARDGLTSMEMVKDPQSRFYPVGMAGLGYPRIRSALVDFYVELIEETGADGFQIEPLGLPIDSDGVAIYGYEKPIVESFQEVYGKDARTIPNSDKTWIDFRCSFTVKLIEEIRRRLKSLDRKVTFSAVGYSLSDDSRYLWPWKTIVRRQLVDEFYFRVSPLEPKERLKEINQAKMICEEAGVPFIPSFDLKGYKSSIAEGKTGDVETCLESLIEEGTQRIALYGTYTIISAWPEILERLKKQDHSN